MCSNISVYFLYSHFIKPFFTWSLPPAQWSWVSLWGRRTSSGSWGSRGQEGSCLAWAAWFPVPVGLLRLCSRARKMAAAHNSLSPTCTQLTGNTNREKWVNFVIQWNRKDTMGLVCSRGTSRMQPRVNSEATQFYQSECLLGLKNHTFRLPLCLGKFRGNLNSHLVYPTTVVSSNATRVQLVWSIEVGIPWSLLLLKAESKPTIHQDKDTASMFASQMDTSLWVYSTVWIYNKRLFGLRVNQPAIFLFARVSVLLCLVPLDGR